MRSGARRPPRSSSSPRSSTRDVERRGRATSSSARPRTTRARSTDVEAQAAALERSACARPSSGACCRGPVDHANAIVSIHPGAGGTDAKDWAEMLLRMYLRWCERRGYKTEIIDYQAGDEAGIDGASFTVTGPERLRLPARRERRAPAGAHQPVRRQRAPPDELRRGRGHARHRGRDRHRGQGQRPRDHDHARRRQGRPEREQGRDRRAPEAHADRASTSSAAPSAASTRTARMAHEDAQGASSTRWSSEARGRAGALRGGQGRRSPGAARSAATCCSPTGW